MYTNAAFIVDSETEGHRFKPIVLYQDAGHSVIKTQKILALKKSMHAYNIRH